jgi:hypothetical protein
VNPRRGGEADKIGNRFEGRWAVRHVLEVLAENAESMMIEEVGELGEGIEFSVVRTGGVVEAHQVKRQPGNSNSWSISALGRLGVISTATKQIAQGREFHFVSTVPARKLQELTDRSRSTDSFQIFLSALTEGLRPEFESFAEAVGNNQDAFNILRSFHLQVVDELGLRHTNETVARLLAVRGSSAAAALAVLAEIAIDNLGRTLDVRSIRDQMHRYGLTTTDVTRAPALAAALRVTENSPLIRSALIEDELAKARQIAPPEGLQGREDEVDALARFSGDGGPCLWLAGEPWAGKTALLATFILEPPEEIDIISFFINSRTATDADSSDFTDALLIQLTELLGESSALPSEPRERDAYRRQLLSQAANRVREAGRGLLLVVDGLDEDLSQDSGRRQPSIASLLPADPQPGLRVLVAARTGYELPLDVHQNHALRRCPKLTITPSPWAVVRRTEAEQELNNLLALDDRRELLAFLAASGGELSEDDFAALTGIPPYLVSDAFTGIAARTVIRNRAPSYLAPTYTFAHKQLLAAAKSAFGPAMIEQRRLRIEAWADSYRQLRWPADTPRYLLTSYGQLLTEATRTSRMISLVTDTARHERMLDIAGGHASALREIDNAGKLLVSSAPDDLNSALQLAIERQDVANGHHVSFPVMTTWAAVGNINRAEALARSAGTSRDVMRALVALAIALTRYGRSEFAEKILGSTADPAWADAAFAKMAREAARAHDVSTAAQLAGRVMRRPYADRAFAALVGAAADVGDFEWAEDLLRSEIAEQQMKTQAIASIVAARARKGDTAIALARAKEERDPAVRNAALVALARVTASRHDAKTFEEALRDITNAAIVERCRAESAALVYSNGGRQAVDRLVDSLTEVNAKTQASLELALALVADHQLRDAEDIITEIQSNKPETAITLATAVADTGDLDNAYRLARQISDDRLRDRCFDAIARSAAELGQFDRGEYFAREIAKPEGAAHALAAIARVSYRAGGRDRGVVLATAAEALYRDHAKQRRTSRALQAIATALADIDEAQIAWRLLKSATDQIDRDIAAQSVAPALIRGEFVDDAESLLDSLPDNIRAKSTRAAMVVAYAQIGDRARAEELAESLGGTPQGVVALSRLAMFLGTAGDLTKAADLSRRAARQANQFIRSGAEDVLVSVVGALANLNDVEAALALARSIEIESTRQAAISEVASTFANAGNIGRTMELIQELDAGQSIDKVLIKLIRAITPRDVSLSFELMGQLHEDWARSVARGEAARLLVNTRPELCDALLREAAVFARRSPDPARALGDTAAAASCTELAQPARRLLAEAFTYGSWTSLLTALSQVDPSMLAELADAFAPLDQQTPVMRRAQPIQDSGVVSMQQATHTTSTRRGLQGNTGSVIAWSAGVSAVAATFAGVLAARATTPLSGNPWFVACIVIAVAAFAILFGVGLVGLISWWRSGEPDLTSVSSTAKSGQTDTESFHHETDRSDLGRDS